MEKSELLQKIEELLSFDGNETKIDPAYLDYFTLEELESLLKKLLNRHENMVEENREWMQRFVSKKNKELQPPILFGSGRIVTFRAPIFWLSKI